MSTMEAKAAWYRRRTASAVSFRRTFAVTPWIVNDSRFGSCDRTLVRMHDER